MPIQKLYLSNPCLLCCAPTVDVCSGHMKRALWRTLQEQRSYFAVETQTCTGARQPRQRATRLVLVWDGFWWQRNGGILGVGFSKQLTESKSAWKGSGQQRFSFLKTTSVLVWIKKKWAKDSKSLIQFMLSCSDWEASDPVSWWSLIWFACLVLYFGMVCRSIKDLYCPLCHPFRKP